MNAPGNLADRGARLLAASIDELILLGVALPALSGALQSIVATTVPLVESMMSGGGTNPELIDTDAIASAASSAMLSGAGITFTVLALIIWCVITFWLVATRSQSIGKLMVGIKVVRTDGSPASFARIILLRNVVSFLPSFLPFVGLLYQLVIDPILIFQESRRCVHDMIADTIVVRCVSKGASDST
jgi:uncharacterized RDD family membrane protein YckC